MSTGAVPKGAGDFPPEKDLFTAREAAQYLGITPAGFNYHRRYKNPDGSPRIEPAERIGTNYRYSRAALNALYQFVHGTGYTEDEFTSKEALEYLGVSQETLTRHIRDNHITPRYTRKEKGYRRKQVFTRQQLDTLKDQFLRVK